MMWASCSSNARDNRGYYRDVARVNAATGRVMRAEHPLKVNGVARFNIFLNFAEAIF